MSLKNVFVYYCLILLPMLFFALGIKFQFITSATFVFGLLFYSLVYHPAVSGLRLLALNQITKKQFWNNFIPGWNWKYYNTLFLSKWY